MSKIADIQTILGVKPDGVWGTVSQAALDGLVRAADNHVYASSFADPADVEAYRKAKAAGKTEQEALRLGDNGIGCWGDDCTAPVPICALPPDDWNRFGSGARGKKVKVTALVCGEVRSFTCELRDTMPHKAEITNGCGIDLNPSAVSLLGMKPPIKIPVVWSWA